MPLVALNKIAFARSGDKGNNANVGVIAFTPPVYLFLKEHLTECVVQNYFKDLGLTSCVRYELPNLLAFNFLLHGILKEGGSRSLRVDAQGKALGQALLQITFEVGAEDLAEMMARISGCK